MSIEVRSLSKTFGPFVALDDVSICVPGGSLTALLGPSGSGKSTLLRVIAGLEQPDSGQVFFMGQDVTHVPCQRRGVGFVFQHYADFKHMTVWQNVAFGLDVRKRPRNESRQRVADLLSLVQLEDLADRYPGQLSGGQRQRMVLARALAIEPKVLLLDEPFGALDARVRQDLRDWLRRLHEQVHVTTLLVTHDQEEAMDIADQVVVLDHGRVQQAGTPREIYDQPASPFVMAFIGHVSRLDAAYVRPHDFEISVRATEQDHQAATIERIVFLGFEVRVELSLADGQRLLAQLTRDAADALDLRPRQPVFVRPTRARTFVGGSAVIIERHADLGAGGLRHSRNGGARRG
jgi:sulfate/thiosulfate transport system ATP-binding protein